MYHAEGTAAAVLLESQVSCLGDADTDGFLLAGLCRYNDVTVTVLHQAANVHTSVDAQRAVRQRGENIA